MIGCADDDGVEVLVFEQLAEVLGEGHDPIQLRHIHVVAVVVRVSLLSQERAGCEAGTFRDLLGAVLVYYVVDGSHQ